ncbi:MAG: hypothetical protein AAGH89_18415, partial [Verrucomicrobiota bacterium]
KPIAVIGEQYWPLPWYVRGLGQVGYWDELPKNAGKMPILILMPIAYQEHAKTIDQTHAVFPRGLRDEFPMFVAIRNDVWKAYQEQ